MFSAKYEVLPKNELKAIVIPKQELALMMMIYYQGKHALELS